MELPAPLPADVDEESIARAVLSGNPPTCRLCLAAHPKMFQIDEEERCGSLTIKKISKIIKIVVNPLAGTPSFLCLVCKTFLLEWDAANREVARNINLHIFTQPQIQKIRHEIEKEPEIMDMKQEVINDAMDDAMEDEGDEDETDAIVSQVLDELALQLNDQLYGLQQASGSLTVSGAKVPQAAAVGAGVGSGGAGSPASDSDADLQARLDNLRRE